MRLRSTERNRITNFDQAWNDQGKNYLLAVAVDNYQNLGGQYTLKNCREDARQLLNVLVKEYNFLEENTTLLLDAQATRKGVLNKLKELKTELTPTDNLILLFSGHGTVIDDKFGYWIPYEATLREDAEYISNSDILERLEQIDCRHIFLIIDACFSGSIFKAQSRDLEMPEDRSKNSRWGLTSSDIDEAASDGKPGKHSPFMEEVLEFLRTRREEFSTAELAVQISKEVDRKSDHKQTPIFGRLRMGDDNGRFTIYPRKQIYTFGKVKKFLKRVNVQEAGFKFIEPLDEHERMEAIFLLRNFLGIFEKELPKNYEFHLAFVKNRIGRIDKLRPIDQYSENAEERKNVVSSMEKKLQDFVFPKAIDQLITLQPQLFRQELRPVLNWIGRDELIKAISRLIEKCNDVVWIVRDANLLLYQFQLLNLYRGTKSVEHYEHVYEKLVIHLINLLRQIEGYRGESYAQADLARFYIGRDLIDEARECIENLVHYDCEGDSDLWLLNKTMSSNMSGLLLKNLTGQLSTREEWPIKERMLDGMFFILDAVEESYLTKQKDRTGNHYMQLSDEQKKAAIALLKKGKFDEVFALPFLVEDTGIKELKNNFSELRNNSRDLKLLDYYYRSCFWVKKLMTYLDLFSVPMFEGRIGKETTFREQPEVEHRTMQEWIDMIRDHISSGRSHKAFETLSLLIAGSENDHKEKFKSIEFRFNLIKEDRMFTNKENLLLNKREDQLKEEILTLLTAIEENLSPN
ncbi:MAG: caspase family protein [Saprospiraceae bacterium]